jgi:uncharacterized membrane protein YeaQ/YmgE (transglycosylase-associated protein family)
MNPSYGIIMWLVIGALAGWIASKVMGTDAQQGGLANIVVGVVGALVGGFVTRAIFGDRAGNNGFIASLLIAILGSVILLAIYRAIMRTRLTRQHR